MSCGTDDVGHDELDEDNPVVPTPTRLSSIEGIRFSSVSAGYGCTAAVSFAGTVYTWGTDAYLLGHGDKEGSFVPKQVRALVGHPILSVSLSLHCLAVTERGELFSWGYNSCGQCGHGTLGDIEVLPRRAGALVGVRVRSASAGDWHSLVVTEGGALYSFGLDGEMLGRDHVKRTAKDPEIVDALRHVRIVAAAAGAHHSVALTEDGRVFTWGDDFGGAFPHEVDALRGLNVRAIAATTDSTCTVTAAGELYTWGTDGQFGRLGHGDKTGQLAPKRVEALRGEWVVAVTCGLHHTIAVTRDGGVFGWGKADRLGLPEAAAAVPDDGDCVLTPCRYQQLLCML